ncbi:MAG: hypothetical protein IT449_13860 [Phycisphaerales bacterium]|nr:hypothetical protein [Phycisphaerales bacterium]
MVALLLCLPVRAQEGDSALSPVQEALTAYFQTPQAEERREALAKIETAASGDVRKVAAALPTLHLWKPVDPAEVLPLVSFDVGRDAPLECSVLLPRGYDPLQAHPLIISLHNEMGIAVCATMPRQQLAELTDPPAVIIAPERIPETTFFSSIEETAVVERWLTEVRRRYHIDEDRVYLFGNGPGGDTAWQWAFAHPREIAGLLVEDGYPRVPLAPQLLPMLFENLRGLPILATWRKSAELPDATPSSEGILVTRDTAVAAHSRALAEWAPGAGFAFTSRELAADERGSVEMLSTDDLRVALSSRRAVPSKSVSQLFRTIEQGRSAWLRPARFMGEVWTHPQISVLPAPGVDRDDFAIEVLKSKLGSLSGRIDDQTITIEASRCERIEVLLTDGLIDFSKPVRIVCNGKLRFEGVASPRVKTLLEHARQSWSFQHPVFARLAFNIDSTAVQE